MILALTQWNTINIVLSLPTTTVKVNSIIPPNFNAKWSRSSPAVFGDGLFFTIKQLADNCGTATQPGGPKVFDGAGTLSYKLKKQCINCGGKDIIVVPGKTFAQCGVGKGYYLGWVEWKANECAKNQCITYYGKKKCGIVDTKSSPVGIWFI
jgi:hypothetical protein